VKIYFLYLFAYAVKESIWNHQYIVTEFRFTFDEVNSALKVALDFEVLGKEREDVRRIHGEEKLGQLEKS